MLRRRLLLTGLVAGLAILVAVPAWWLVSRPESSAGSLAALGPAPGPSEPVGELAVGFGEQRLPVPSGAGSRPGIPREPAETIGVRSALLDDRERRRAPRPVSLRIPALDVSAPIAPVGVDVRTRELAVPADRDTVGWYRHGPSPGQPGSAVLAAHVDYGEGRAVFFRLAALEPGAVVEVGFGDGSERRFRVVARRLYEEDRLPGRLFASTGRPVLALVTCGGSYDRDERSYEGNVVVYAVPAGAERA
jgi:hypothetical protein